MFNYKYHIFCCINERPKDNPKGSYKAKGSEEILDYLKGIVRDRGLKKEVKVSASKCLGVWSQCPSVVIYPEGTWYSVSTVEDAKDILEKHVLNGKIVDRLIIK